MAGEADNPRPSSAGVIFYCDKCGQRIPPADFQNKTARLSSDNLACCAKCAGAKPSVRMTPAAGVAKPENQSGPQPRQTAARRTAPAKAPASSNMGILLGGGAVLVVGLVMFFAMRSGGSAQKSSGGETAVAKAPENAGAKPAPVTQSTTASKPTTTAQTPVMQNPAAQPTPAPGATEKAPPRPIMPPAEEYDPRKAVSESLLTQAKEYHQKNPDDLYTYSEKLEWLRDRYRGTGAAEEARKLLSEIKLPEADPNNNPAPPVDEDFKQTTSVLASIKPNEDSRKGQWSAGNGTIKSDLSTWSKLEAPCILPDEYDLRATFSRVDREDCLLIVLARRGKPFIFSIGGAGNTGCSFETIAEKRKDRVPTKISRPGVLSNGVKNQVVIQVRRDCLRAYLNGKLIVGCQVDDGGLSLTPEFQSSKPGQFGLMTWSSVYEFHSIEIKPIAGEVKMLR